MGHSLERSSISSPTFDVVTGAGGLVLGPRAPAPAHRNIGLPN
jgi:hypothetical protein